MKQGKKKLVKKIISSPKRDKLIAAYNQFIFPNKKLDEVIEDTKYLPDEAIEEVIKVESKKWDEFDKDLKEMVAERKQRDVEFKLSIVPAKQNEVIDKLITVVRNKLIDLFNDIEKEFSEDEINLIEGRIEIPDSIGNYRREVFRGKTLKEIINNFITIILERGKTVITQDQYEKIFEEIASHRNQKGKLWRAKLLEDAKKILKENPRLSKTQCLKIAFDNLPANQKDEKDIDLHFKSILDTFYTKTNFQPKYKKKKS